MTSWARAVRVLFPACVVLLPAIVGAQGTSCLLGVTGYSNAGVTGLTYAGTQILALADPRECEACAPGSGMLARAVQLRMTFTMRATMNVRVAVYAPPPGSCPTPDTSMVHVEPFLATISDGAGVWPDAKDYDI